MHTQSLNTLLSERITHTSYNAGFKVQTVEHNSHIFGVIPMSYTSQQLQTINPIM